MTERWEGGAAKVRPSLGICFTSVNTETTLDGKPKARNLISIRPLNVSDLPPLQKTQPCYAETFAVVLLGCRNNICATLFAV